MPPVSGWNNLAVFRDSLVSMLELGKKTDRGCQGAAPTYVKCPGVVEADPNTAEIQQRVRSRQETVNERFKIGPFCWSTKQFLVLLSFSPSFLLLPTICFK